MIKRVKVDNINDNNFCECWALYNEAFPIEERRSLEYQTECFERSEYAFIALFDDDVLIGFISEWEFDAIIYIEHFAVFPHLRNFGYGKKVLENMVQNSTKPLLLEVEHPITELQKRRIAFYERLGFKLNNYEYAQPPYDGNDFVELIVMTYPREITQEELDFFRDNYFPVIHFRYYNDRCKII